MVPPPPPPPPLRPFVFQFPPPLVTLLPVLRCGARDCRRRGARDPRVPPGRLWDIGDAVCRSDAKDVGDVGGIQACF